MAADIPFMEVTGRKDVQNGGRSILKMTTGFGLFSSLSKVKIYFFLLFASNLSYFNNFKLPYKIRRLGFRSPLILLEAADIEHNWVIFPRQNMIMIMYLLQVDKCEIQNRKNLNNFSPKQVLEFCTFFK